MEGRNQDAEKVEESLRDFIGRIITYYEKYTLPGEILDRYEKMISEAETLLEVFDIMKDMFEELMKNLDKFISKDDLLSESSHNQKENLEKILQNYESEINTHAKVEQNMQALINQYKGKIEELEGSQESAKQKLIRLEKDLKQIGEQNRLLESANMQYKAMVNPGYGSKDGSGRKSKSTRRINRLCTSAEKLKVEFPLGDPNISDLKSSLPKRPKNKFSAMATQPTRELAPDILSFQDGKKKQDIMMAAKKKKASTAHNDTPEIPRAVFSSKGFGETQAQSNALNLSNSLGQVALDKASQGDQGLKNYTNTYYVHRHGQVSSRQRETDRTKNRVKQAGGTSQNTKRRPITQPGLLLMGTLGLGKSKTNRSSSRHNIYMTENNHSCAGLKAAADRDPSGFCDMTNLSRKPKKSAAHL